MKKYDLAIIGSGPAGYTASIYAGRYRVNTIIIGESPGGTISDAHKVCNFPTFKKISGKELSNKMEEVSRDLDTEILQEKVLSIKKEKDYFTLTTSFEKEIKAKTVLLTIGTKRRKLNIEKEDEFLGSGVSYCSTCDGPFFKDKVTAVVGGSNSATTSALYLSDLAKKVYLIYRKSKLKGEVIWREKIAEKDNIEVIYNTNVTELKGKTKLESIKLDNGKEIKVDGLFIEVGSVPRTDLIKELKIETDDKGYVKVKEDQSTNVKGLYAAGDITTNSNKIEQVVTACSEGAIAATSIYNFIKSKK